MPEVVPEEVDLLWSDLLSGRSTVSETVARTRRLMDTANATHVASAGLSALHAVTFGRDDSEVDRVMAYERWRQHVREYDADPVGWNIRYYQRMIVGFAERHGTDRARQLGAKMVASGELSVADVEAALAQE